MPASRSSLRRTSSCCSLSRSRARSGSVVSRLRASRSFTAVSCSRPWARTRRIASSSASSASATVAGGSGSLARPGTATADGSAPAASGGGSSAATTCRRATSRISDASALSGSRRSDASARRTAEAWEPVASACRESAASVAASPRITVRARSSPSRPSKGRNTPSFCQALRASSTRYVLSLRGGAGGMSTVVASPPNSSSSRAFSRSPAISTTESRSARSGGRRPGSMRSSACGASVASDAPAGQATGRIERPPSVAAAWAASAAASGAANIPPLALARAARQGQLICGPMPRLDTATRPVRTRSMSRAKSPASMPLSRGPSPM